MEVEDTPRSPLARLLEQFDRRHLGHALAGGTLGAGAALIGFLMLALSLPRAVSADPVLDPRPVIAPTVAKADRLPLPGGKLAVIAAEVAAERQPSSGVVDLGSNVDSALSYAVGLPSGAAARAIEDHVDRVGTRYASLGPSGLVVPGAAAAAIDDQAADDEEDDESVVAIPRSRPERPAATAAEPLAMPRPRPAHLASLAPAPLLPAPGAAASPSEEPDEPEAAPPTRRGEAPGRPTGLLGFFSSPTEPVKAPPKITVDTPFGVPYVLQTATVETACLKPELIDILRRIETKYGQKVVVTSGYRNRGRSGSLHRTCAAADIEIPGVPASTVADFARTIPGIGGVGTYCHSELVHVDVGTPRDWKYGCGSFFAMRGAPGRWGKVPAALAAAQPVGDARVDPSMIQD